jgi:hypothetical protein
MTVERLENEMSADELDDWTEFYKLEPFGDEERMFDKRNSVLCAITANSGISNANKQASDYAFYQNNVRKVSELDTEDMTDEQIKEAQSAILQIMTAK